MAADAQAITNPNASTGRGFRNRLRFMIAPLLVAYAFDVIPWPPSETPRRLTVGVLSISGLVVLYWAGSYRRRAARSNLASYVGLPVTSAELASRQARRARTRSETAARYGQAPAQLARRTTLMGRRVLLAAEAFLLVMIVWVSFLGSGWLSVLIFPAVTVAASGAMTIATKAVVRASSLAIAAMADASGVRDVNVRTLPWTPDQYTAWCREQGVEAYPFRAAGVAPGTGQEPGPGGS